MKHSNLKDANDDRSATTMVDEAANENYRQVDSDELEASSGFFRRRAKYQSKMRKREWWIVAGLYALLIGMAVVMV